MARTLYLHIGLGRCGSTAIQHFGDRHRDVLRERGIAYPSPVDMGFAPGESGGGNGRALAKSDDAPRAVELIARFLAEQEDERFLISAEHLASAGDARLRLLVQELAKRDIRVVGICYVREQREWLVSKWAQNLKHDGFAVPLDAFVTDFREGGWPRMLRYDVRGRRLSKTFGRENVVLRRFSRDALVGGDVRIDALAQAGVDVTDLVAADPGPANASPGAEAAVVARIANEAGGELLPGRAVLRQAQALGLSGGPPLYRLCPAETMRAVAEYYAPFNEAFREAFLPEVPAPVFSSSVPDDYESLREDDVLTTRSLRLLADVARNRSAQMRRSLADAPR